jgi:hypothetical protein
MAKADQNAKPIKSIQLNKHFSAPALLNQIRKDFEKITDHRSGNQIFSLPDVLMSGLAVFGLKCPSLLKFDEQRNEARIRANLRTLYGVAQAPCDTQIRTVLDEVSPDDLHAPFINIHRQLFSQKMVEKYRYLDSFLFSVDGTGQFSSSKISCPDCCEKKHRNGKTEYYHQLLGIALVHPDKPQVLPWFPEAITRQDGATKNDCESNASKRLLPALRAALPKWPIIIIADSLSGTGPHIKLLKELEFGYIIVVQPGDHEALFEEVQRRLCAGQVEEFEERGKDGVLRGYRFVNAISLNKSHPDLLVNYLDYWEETPKGKKYTNSWVTHIHLTRDNVHTVMRGGRARWKIENETYNTLKNQDYHLEHNYGHGQKHLSTVFALLMMLAFLIDQIQEFCCELFQTARQKFRSRTSLWNKMRALFTEYFIDQWETLWLAIIYGHKGGALEIDTS